MRSQEAGTAGDKNALFEMHGYRLWREQFREPKIAILT
jgi:hypothetical protein